APSPLGLFRELGLLSAQEHSAVLTLFEKGFPFARALANATTLHVHLRVDDVAGLPHETIEAGGGAVENRRDGYIKYAVRGGVNVILSAIDVAEDDRLPGPGRRRPHLDHVGIDLREVSTATRALFAAAPQQAAALGWRHVAQGGPDRPVFCCHTSVAEKHW